MNLISKAKAVCQIRRNKKSPRYARRDFFVLLFLSNVYFPARVLYPSRRAFASFSARSNNSFAISGLDFASVL